jgi:hypothetical protein
MESVCLSRHKGIHHFPKCCTRCVAYPNYMHIKTSVNQTVYVFYNKATSQIGTNVRAGVFDAGLLARSQFASGRSCDRPTRSRFSVVFLGPRANAKLVPKFHVALHASHEALQTLTFQNLGIIYPSQCQTTFHPITVAPSS